MNSEMMADEAAGILLVNVHGELTLEGIGKLTMEAGEAVKAGGLNGLLFDMRDTTSPGLSALDALYLVQSAQKRGMMKHFRRALVRSEREEDYRFFETLCENSGQIVRVFSDTESAREWLTPEGRGGVSGD